MVCLLPPPGTRAAVSAPESRRCSAACAPGVYGKHCVAPFRSVEHVLELGSTTLRPATQVPVRKALSAAEHPDSPVSLVNNTLATH